MTHAGLVPPGATFMEGTDMVALLDPSFYVQESSRGPLPSAIKVLDLLTNRYHVGIVHAASEERLAIEMPLSARLNAGQRVQYVLANDTCGVIPRRTMRTALVQHVDTSDNVRLRADLTMTMETAGV